MSKQLLIYERATPISSELHGDWSVQSGKNFAFAEGINSSPLLAAEFSAAAPEFSIIFAGTEDAVFPTVILGFQDGQNIFVGKDGAWKGKYVTAFLRRYPFVFAESEGKDSFTLCIDEEFEGLNKEGKGERLFDSEGNRTQYLSGILNFVSSYQGQYERTKLFCDRLVQLKVLDPAQARFSLPDGKTGSLAGFFTINRDKLKAIPQELLAEMFQNDELELCYLHLQSLNNINTMAQHLDAAVGSETDAAVGSETDAAVGSEIDAAVGSETDAA
jgi:hypothetical protein